MRARDVMSRPVVSVSTGATIHEAVTLLTEHRVGAVPVVDDAEHVVGIFTESDGLRAGRRGTDPVTSAMSTPVEVIAPGTEVPAIAARMLDLRLRELSVVSEGQLIGIVTRRDLLRTLVRTDRDVVANVRGLLDRYAGRRRHWEVTVADGTVTISGGFVDDAERTVVAALARTVGGVRAVELTGDMPAVARPVGWDD